MNYSSVEEARYIGRDSGSEASFVSHKLQIKLSLPTKATKTEITELKVTIPIEPVLPSFELALMLTRWFGLMLILYTLKILLLSFPTYHLTQLRVFHCTICL